MGGQRQGECTLECVPVGQELAWGKAAQGAWGVEAGDKYKGLPTIELWVVNYRVSACWGVGWRNRSLCSALDWMLLTRTVHGC